MKGKNITYWITTAGVCAWMLYMAYRYLTHDPPMVAGFASLGYPGYLMAILATAKILGVIALLAPRLPRLKEWAYAGFTFTFLGACWSHLVLFQTKAAGVAIGCLGLLVISYCCRPLDRRIAALTEVVPAELPPPRNITPFSPLQ